MDSLNQTTLVSDPAPDMKYVSDRLTKTGVSL